MTVPSSDAVNRSMPRILSPNGVWKATSCGASSRGAVMSRMSRPKTNATLSIPSPKETTSKVTSASSPISFSGVMRSSPLMASPSR